MSSPICADSSALANAVMGRLPVLRQELNDVFGQARIVFAPSLIHFEMVNTLWKYVRAGSIDNKRCREMLDAFLALPIRLVDDDDSSPARLELIANPARLSGYDGHFVARVTAPVPNFGQWTSDWQQSGRPKRIATRPLVDLTRWRGVRYLVPVADDIGSSVFLIATMQDITLVQDLRFKPTPPRRPRSSRTGFRSA